MISKSVDDLEYISINDEVGLTGIICPTCGARIPLLNIFSFDQKKGTSKEGLPLFADHVDLTEDYTCDCGEQFRVYLDCKYAITKIPTVKEVGRFQEETVVVLDETKEDSFKLQLPEK